MALYMALHKARHRALHRARHKAQSSHQAQWVDSQPTSVIINKTSRPNPELRPAVVAQAHRAGRRQRVLKREILSCVGASAFHLKKQARVTLKQAFLWAPARLNCSILLRPWAKTRCINQKGCGRSRALGSGESRPRIRPQRLPQWLFSDECSSF